MELKKTCLLVVLAILSSSQGFNTVTPWDKEVIYNWRALIKAGTKWPADFASIFELLGKIHVQTSNSASYVKITDLTYKLYNGKMDHFHEKETHSVPVPDQIQDLHHTFKILHGNHGEVLGIVTEAQEKEFSRNIKKAIATILQINDTIVKEPHLGAFVTKEHSIYGYGAVDYVVFPHGGDELEVHKLHDMQDNHHLYQYHLNMVEPGHCDVPFEDILMHDSKKKYTITKQDGHHVVKSIVSHGAIVYYPFKAQSDAQFVSVNQTFQLVHVVPIQEHFHVQSEQVEHSLNYHVADDEFGEAAPDLTNGRHVVDYTKLLPLVEEMIKEVPQYLKSNHIHTREPNTKQGQLINRIQRLLKHFNVEKLEEMRKILSGEDLEIFYRILPLVGTRASTLYVKRLVMKNEVNSEIIVSMLQNLPDYVILPTVELLTELEELIHLGENYPWNVRRVAILSFATLIHKSKHSRLQIQRRIHHQHQNNEADLEQPYEKYVVEFVNKIKNSKDYKVQLTYIMALLNVKLQTTLKYLRQAMEGQWGDSRNLRFYTTWTAGSTVLLTGSPDLVMEVLWPVFSNPKEHTELRMAAYLYIMESQPSHNRLNYIVRYMMNDPDEELYRFHYTYVQTIARSKDPCKQAIRVKLAQMLKFMNPPSHGVAQVEYNDYVDAEYGFGSAIYSLFAKTNNSIKYGIFSTKQLYNKVIEKDRLHIQFDGAFDEDFSISNLVADLFLQKLSNVTKIKEASLTVIRFKHGNAIDIYYVDEINYDDVHTVLSLFNKDSHSINKRYLSIYYDTLYIRSIIPTDFGTPAIWEHLQPEVHQLDVNIRKEVTNKVATLHVRNKYVSWIHHRHGLSFYNPIVDVWQGINRYHSFDTVLPVNFDISLNAQQSNLQITWKKRDIEANTAGLRAHVKQMVFVKDDYQKNVLVQSSPTSKEWQIVSNGALYRNNFTLIDYDDLNTGHKWYVGAYDCGRHFTNGSFNHLLHQVFQPSTKSFSSPLSQLSLGLANFQQLLLYLPRPGVHGLIIKAEPSQKYDISSITLSLRIHQDTSTRASKSYKYTPGDKWITRLTYSIKNQEQNLKTWDVNALVNMNPGHTNNNFKIHFTRGVSGEVDYTLCVEGSKKWIQEEVHGDLEIGITHSPQGKCSGDDAVIGVTMRGERSHQQDHEHHKYKSCHYVMPYPIQPYHTLQCLADHTSVRHYVYEVRTAIIPTELRKILVQMWDHFKAHYISYYNWQEERNQNISESTFVVDVLFPTHSHTIDIYVRTPLESFSFTGVPTDYLRSFGIHPDSTVYSLGFEYMHKSGYVQHCEIFHDHHHYSQHRVDHVVPPEWTLYIGEEGQTPEEAIYVKHVDKDKIAVKAVDHRHIVEIVPHGDSYQITLDGQVIEDKERYHENWIHFHIFVDEVKQPIAMMLTHSGFHIKYDVYRAMVIVPKDENQQLHGQCVETL